MNFAALAGFNLVATHGGFGLASRASGQPKATLSRHVRVLEESLGVRLIERGARELKLTSEGALLHARTIYPFDEIVQVTDELKSGIGRPRGILRVSVPLLFAHTSMGRVGAAFLAAYPEVRLDVVAEDRLVDLVGDGYDVVVRFNPTRDDALVGRRFLSDRLVLVAPPDMPRPLQGAGPAGDPELRAVVRRGRTDGAPWTIIDDAGSLHTFLPVPVLSFSTPLLVRDALLAGAGAALVPRSAVLEDISAGRLVEWGVSPTPLIEGWVLHASRRLVSPKVSAFVSFLCDRFAR
ncbi:LysR family transcriptional regulator [Pseudomonas putida]|uniref:LysR family transcriptional regulator n=1 Tax=Pseudomonas putida TaxID=303 RepID=UPI00117A4DEE|nr:LysR substrate-binding domain-containing protein [Pseudomonas putida]TRO38311.1 LysR family transcriptional regulator [Pseudomonas putida]